MRLGEASRFLVGVLSNKCICPAVVQSQIFSRSSQGGLLQKKEKAVACLTVKEQTKK